MGRTNTTPLGVLGRGIAAGVAGTATEAAASRGLKCRLYPTADGLQRTPPDEWVAVALARSKQATA